MAGAVLTPVRALTLPRWLPELSGRLGLGLVTIVAISLIVFLATQALPSDPARVILGPDATEAAVAVLRAQLGLDQPIVTQYLVWAGNALRGDFGLSIDSGLAVTDLLGPRLVASLVLVFWVMLVSVPLSFVIGVWLARHADSRVDRATLIFLIFLKGIPAFVIAILLVLLLAIGPFRLFPAVALLDPYRPVILQLDYLALPVLTLVLAVVPYLVRLVRASMIEVLVSDYITAARLRGISGERLVWRHAFPAAVIPAIQGIAMMVRVLLGGMIVVEVVFAYPGLGTALNAAIEMRDIPVIQALAVLIAAAVVLINIIADSLTVLLTPTLRTAERPAIRPGTRARIRQEAGL